jgi:hypothetical protein
MTSDPASRSKRVAYWVTTGITVAALAGAGVAEIARSPKMVEGFALLGYPAYLATLLGIWKLLAVPALLAPRFPRLKEWAYAGIFFDLSGAAISHVAVPLDPTRALGPLVLLAVAMASWALKSARDPVALGSRRPAEGTTS